MIIYSYGGRDILINLFQAVAKLHNGGFLKQLLGIGATVGLVLAMLRAFFSLQSPIELVRTWFLPMILGVGILLLPKTSVMVVDIITKKHESVDNVPYGLGLMARVSSNMGYAITQGLEKVLGVHTNLAYNSTGHVFGGEHLMDIANFTWTDPTAEQNMRNFVVNCISYDVMLGRYSIDNLKNKLDLWGFIQGRTSQTRGLYWIARADEGDGAITTQYCSCREAATRLTTNLTKEVAVKKNHHILKHMPIAFQALTGVSESADTLLRQQLVLHSFVEGVEEKSAALGLGHNFALQRAYLQQQSTMMIAGGMAGKSVVVTRAIFEALILISFVFVVPMLALPMGIRYFGKWAEMVVWINLWPPVYAILNFILQSAAQSRAKALLKFQEDWTGLGGTSKTGLSLVTATPLANLYNDMVAYAGWASLFVPVLAYMIMKGGMSSFVHIAGNMLQASQGAASAAAQEQVTGNYSYGNVSLGNTQYNTSQMNQQGLAARYSDGYLQESTGGYDVTYTAGGSVMNQNVSHLPVSFSVGQALSKGYQRRAESSLQSAYNEGAQLSRSWDSAYHEMTALDQHMSKHSGTTEGQSIGVDASTQKSMQTVMSQTQAFAKKYGIDESRAMSILTGINGTASIGGDVKGVALGLSVNAGANYSGSATKQQMMEDAISIATSKDFTESMSQLKRFSQHSDFSEGQDMGKRLSETLSSSFDQSDQLSKSMSQHLSAAESYSKSATYARDNSARVDQNYTDQFWGYVVEKAGGTAQAIEIMNSHSPATNAYRQDLIQSFQDRIEREAMAQVDSRVATDSGFNGATSQLAQQHDASVANMKQPSRMDYDGAKHNLQDKAGLSTVHQEVNEAKKIFNEEGVNVTGNMQQGLNRTQKHLQNEKQNMQKDMMESDDETVAWKAGRATFNPYAFENASPSKKKEK